MIFCHQACRNISKDLRLCTRHRFKRMDPLRLAVLCDENLSSQSTRLCVPIPSLGGSPFSSTLVCTVSEDIFRFWTHFVVRRTFAEQCSQQSFEQPDCLDSCLEVGMLTPNFHRICHGYSWHSQSRSQRNHPISQRADNHDSGDPCSVSVAEARRCLLG